LSWRTFRCRTSLPRFWISASEWAWWRRGRYTQYAAAESLDLAAANTGGGAGVGMGLGAGSRGCAGACSAVKSPATAPVAQAVSETDTKFCIDCGKRFPRAPNSARSAGSRSELSLLRRSDCVETGYRGLQVRLLPHCFLSGEEDDGVEVTGEPADESLVCPLCNVPLVHAAIAKIPILYCKECHGLLLAMQVLQPILENCGKSAQSSAVQTPPDRGDLKRTIQCQSATGAWTRISTRSGQRNCGHLRCVRADLA